MENRDQILLLWDIDGTLMHCGADGTKALNETFHKICGAENATGEIKIGSAMDSMIVERIMEQYGIPKDQKREILALYAKTLEEILEKNQSKRILPGISEILEHYSQKEAFLMGILTSNFKIGADIKLQSVGLKKYFSFGGYGDIDGEKWDAAKVAIEKAEKLSGRPIEKKHIFLIGDTKYDVECAKKLGIRSVAVGTGWTDYEALQKEKPDYLFKTLENTKDFYQIFYE